MTVREFTTEMLRLNMPEARMLDFEGRQLVGFGTGKEPLSPMVDRDVVRLRFQEAETPIHRHD